MFWTFFEIYSRRNLVTELRQKLLDNVFHTGVTNSGNHQLGIMGLADVRDHCLRLVSKFQKSLCTRSHDTLLDSHYLLKTGATIQMPGKLINREKSSWGDDSNTFDPFRFMARTDKKEQK